jgi:hypothetical protein
MSKEAYISAIEVKPVDCNKKQNQRFPITSLSTKEKALCWPGGEYSGISEIGGISYDNIIVFGESSKVLDSLGFMSHAFFLEDRLIILKIYSPKVSLDMLTVKYGLPRMIDNSKTEICTNKIGNKFDNRVGIVDAAWSNGKVRAVFRAIFKKPTITCTDTSVLSYYILEESGQLAIIETAIEESKSDLAKKKASDSPF